MNEPTLGGVEQQLELQEAWNRLLAQDGLPVLQYQRGFLLAAELTGQELDELDTLMTGREHDEVAYPEEGE